MARYYEHTCQWCGFVYEYNKYENCIDCPRCECEETFEWWTITKDGKDEEDWNTDIE